MSATAEQPAFDLADPAAYSFFQRENVRFSDTDMVGHVNNVAHVALVEAGRLAFAFDAAERAGVETGLVTFVRLEIDFRDDLYYPAAVRIGARVLRVGNSSFTVGIGVFDGDRCVSTSVNVLVHLGDDRRPAPLPDAMRSALERSRLGQP
ncbi:acyl-CoA thioesterase [Euzebya tangerina]|uniref:acyl-CoA thioesterase n=1 Tax=Euzebya tangerina TaxID=591198 RepID=UPI000E320D11|nr:thioesterase family protein [Euzebya tangerina]